MTSAPLFTPYRITTIVAIICLHIGTSWVDAIGLGKVLLDSESVKIRTGNFNYVTSTNLYCKTGFIDKLRFKHNSSVGKYK